MKVLTNIPRGRLAFLLGALAAASTVAGACGDSVEPRKTSATGTSVPSPTATAAPAPIKGVEDAPGGDGDGFVGLLALPGDAGGMPDAAASDGAIADAGVADSGVIDAGVADTGIDSGKDSGPADTGPPDPTVVLSDSGLSDFDFAGNDLVFRTSRTPTDEGFRHCVLPGCGSANVLAPSRLYNNYSPPWWAGGDGRFHYLVEAGMQASWESLTFDGKIRATAVGYGADAGLLTPTAYHGGTVGKFWFSESVIGGRTNYVSKDAGGANATRVARATRCAGACGHTNEGGATFEYVGATIVNGPPPAYGHVWRPASISGISAPVPSGPGVLAVSAKGPAVPYPMAIIGWNNVGGPEVQVCPLATPCAAWLSLGPLGLADAAGVAMDGTHLYLARPAGLARCALSEIATTGTCTPVAHGPAVAAQSPLYLTSTDAWFRSGTTIRRVPK